MSDKINPFFLQNIINKSYSKEPNIALSEWTYIDQVKHLNGIQSPCKNYTSLIYNSVSFFNFKTNEIFHCNTSKLRYLLYVKGKDKKKITQQNPTGDGSSQDVNINTLNKINNFLTSVEKKHITKSVNLDDIKTLSMYRYFLKDIDILEKHTLEELLKKINYLIKLYNINFCSECREYYLSKFKQSEFIRKCLNCLNKNDVCFLKLIKNK